MTEAAKQEDLSDAETNLRQRLEIRGMVQGVGFRPFLYRLAETWGLSGFAMNAAQGVIAEVEGPAHRVAGFIGDIRRMPPENAVVTDIAVTRTQPVADTAFAIRDSSRAGGAATSVPPDLASCPACLEDVFGPGNRRYLYPFTNCTDCGPRYSLIEALPYDRARTAMRHFAMCSRCQAEYDDPNDRRFHAEPNACPDCGPQLSLLNAQGEMVTDRHAALTAAAEALREGAIVAVKGLGGFHLMADARSDAAVMRLRERKRRPAKPFALMSSSVEAVRAHCLVSLEEEALLDGRERPIVLLRRRPGEAAIACSVALGSPLLGFMLAYTPLHHILMAELGFPVVATSGNRADEPIVIDNAEAVRRLAGIADRFLLHDRPILRPVDDSVVRVFRGRPQMLRRARGYAPTPVATKPLIPGIVSMGGHLKATIGLTRTDGVVLSQHLGDLDSPESRDGYEGALNSLLSLHDVRPRAIVSDLHPDYHSTCRAEAMGVPVFRVQHHLAHVAAAIAENGIKPPVLGVAWDGTGFGTDGTIWGSEFLHIAESGWQRVAHLRPFRLPGGSAAIREPRRAALGLLYEIFAEEVESMATLPPLATFSSDDRAVLRRMLAQGLNAPYTSSVGRLFDAVAALLGLCQSASYEGQAACGLEWAAEGSVVPRAPYSFPLSRGGRGEVRWTIDWEPAIRQILSDIEARTPTNRIAAAFHAGLAAAIVAVAERMEEPDVAISGGCFQNAVLLEQTIDGLAKAGFRPHWHKQVPCNDGGLALGQAWWAARLIEKEDAQCA